MSEQKTNVASRQEGRELALFCLCHLERFAVAERRAELEGLWAQVDDSDSAWADNGSEEGALAEFARRGIKPQVRRFAETLMEHFVKRGEVVDEELSAVSKKWRLDRMEQIERNILRVAAIELKYSSTPSGVIASESVRLAARFGGERSAPFVNGLVQSCVARLRPNQDP